MTHRKMPKTINIIKDGKIVFDLILLNKICNHLVVIIEIVCFYWHPKEQSIIENKIEQRLQIGRQ